MANQGADRRIDIRRLDKDSIRNISNDVARMLTEISQMDPDDPDAKFHLKIGHIKIQFRNSNHVDVIIGKPDEGPTDGTPPRG